MEGPMSRRMKRPSPAMAVAMAALLVAVVGTAIAAPAAIRSALNKSEKKRIAKIANQQITKRAPGLSVAGAGTANSANLAQAVQNGAIGTAQMANGIPAASAYTTSQSIPNNTTTDLVLDNEHYDTANMHSNATDNFRITAPVDGIYAVSAQVAWDINPNGERILRLMLNGTDPIATVNQLPVTGAAQAQSVSAQVELDAGDHIVTEVHQNSGGSLGLSGPIGASVQVTWQAPG